MSNIEKRSALIAEMKAMNELAEKEARSFTDEEKKLFDEKEAEVRTLSAEIEKEARAKTLSDFAGLDSTVEPKEERNAQLFKAERTATGMELRTADMTVADGGAALAPQQFVEELEKNLQKETLIYARVKKIPVSGAGSLGLPYEKTDASAAGWTAEVPTNEISADNTWEFAKRELAPSDLTKLIKVSKKLLATSALPIDQLAQEKITEKLTAAFENAIVNGNGSGQPLGIFAASNDGIPTSRDVTSEGNLAITADDLINVYMSIRPVYRRNCVWVMNTQTVKDVMKLKDKNDQYLWQESLRANEPPRLLGLPVLESEYAPIGSGSAGAWAANDYALALGDLSHYQFAYWKGLEITIAKEVFAGKNQVGFYGHTLADGCPTLPEAFARLKMAATPST